MEEKEQLYRLARGDQNALKTIFDTHYTPLVRYALKISGTTETAEEIVQDIFVWLWEKRNNLNIEGQLGPYLARAVKNKSINYVKSRYHKTSQESVDPYPNLVVSSRSGEDVLAENELAAILEEAQHQLPEQTALVFSMSRHAEMTYPEIARELKISIKTVEYHISKALKSIREFLTAKGFSLTFLFCFLF